MTYIYCILDYPNLIWRLMMYILYSRLPQPEMATNDIYILYSRLPQPDMATNDVYDYMLKCWEYNPQER